MTGPEHYREAERLLDVAESTYWEGPDSRVEFAQASLAAAQVHAMLALAAATAAGQATAYDGDEDHSRSRGWAGVA